MTKKREKKKKPKEKTKKNEETKPIFESSYLIQKQSSCKKSVRPPRRPL